MVQVLDVAGFIATEDDTAAEHAESVFQHFRRSRKAGELEEEVRKLLARSSGPPIPPGQAGHPERPDVFLLDINMPYWGGKEIIRKMLQNTSEALVIVLTSAVDDQLRNALDAGADDYLLKPFRREDLFNRIERLLKRRAERRSESGMRLIDPPLPHLVEMLHSEKGQLDARKVATFFGLTVAELARLLGRGVSTVHKTPHAPNLQGGLRQLESIASGLMRLTGSERRSRMWLQAANPALEGHAPIELLKLGKVAPMQQFVQDLLEGRPA